MLLPNIIIAACCLSASTLASTWPSSIAGYSLPDNLAETPSAVTDYITQWTKSLTSTIKTLYNPETCNSMSGTYEDVKWYWRSADPECDIKAQRDAISRAVKHYMASKDNGEQCQDCNTKCLRMDAGSLGDGWLKLGAVGGFDEEAYCGPTLTFNSYLDDDNGRCEQYVL
ncbi:uncharacterized protein N7479_011020 [Penicillium vulpinum]|uniref:Secreted protein CSS2 C-terminal domain-containing protein n=1 Tax=Penicillium vulpinum TaxID=29845 RepID=A0A1V6RSV4_9EURO|nr:uncharacterized protein N7479_011020 [Penicillium vulpinum]KAJ5952607.1 hypothetical protein N7479_011020 [Penicillium vulpinum]OQE04862.1 hypothetical protein PENVUL_c029G03523 [Penicillium vulpinum]